MRFTNMNILIVGNGFDLAHELPTKYEDFLGFLKIIKLIDKSYFIKHPDQYNLIQDEIKNEKMRKALRELALYKESKPDLEMFGIIHCYICKEGSIGKSCSCELLRNPANNDIIRNNKWIDYFLSIYESMHGKGWIDIECEIQKVMKFINDIRDYAPIDEKKMSPISLKNLKIEQIIARKDLEVDWVTKREFVNILENDMDDFIQCLEQYILLVNKISTEIRLPMVDLQIDKVLSFNYTNTYEKYYGENLSEESYNYIHGQAGQNNIILGFNEYLKDDEKNEKLLCIRFKKFFQRIYKETGCSYKNWITKNREHNVFVFGHSLDTTDKDIISEIIMHEDVQKTTIFYHNEESHARQIMNLVKIIGQDNLIEKVYKKSPQIVFKKQ